MRNNIQAYKKVNIESSLLSADPHQVVLMMYNGALDNMAQAKGAIERKQYEKKSTFLNKAINILRALQGALDNDSEPMISKNFNELYEYSINGLLDANATLDVRTIDEISDFLKPLRDAWQQMPEAGKQEGFELLKKKAQENQNIGA